MQERLLNAQSDRLASCRKRALHTSREEMMSCIGQAFAERKPQSRPDLLHVVQERFLSAQDADKANIKKSSFNTFGEGMRACIDQKFVSMDIKLTSIRLLQAYTFQLAPDQDPKQPLPSRQCPSRRCSSLRRLCISACTAAHNVSQDNPVEHNGVHLLW